MRLSKKEVNPSLKRELVNTLAQTVSDLNSPKEALVFIRDFFSQNELGIFSKRLAVAYWLKKGRSYTNIQRNLKVSSATISEVSQMMTKKGFSLGIKKIEAEEWSNKWVEKFQKLKPKNNI